jgi:hypothetical protein
LNVALEIGLRFWVPCFIRKTDLLQQILKSIDKVQHSLYWLNPEFVGRSFLGLKRHSFAKIETIPARFRAPHLAAFSRWANHAADPVRCGRGKAQSHPAKAASFDSRKSRRNVLLVVA